MTVTAITRRLAVVAMAALLLCTTAAPAAEAAKRRTERQRIWALEKQARSLRAELKDTNASMMDAYELALAAQENATIAFKQFECMRPLEMNQLAFSLPGAETPLLAFQPGIAGKTPDFYTVEIDVQCLRNARSPILAGFVAP